MDRERERERERIAFVDDAHDCLSF